MGKETIVPKGMGYKHNPSDTSFVQKRKIKKAKKAQTAVQRRQKMNVIKKKVSKSGIFKHI